MCGSRASSSHCADGLGGVLDVVDANLLCLTDDRANYEMFHVGGDRPVTVKDFARVVSEVYGVRDYEPQPSGKYRFGDTRHICSSVPIWKCPCC